MIDLKKDAFFTFFNSILVLFFGIIVSVILARVLGPEERGKYAIMILIPTVLLRIGTAGIEVANVYYTANGQYSRKDIVANAVIISAAFGILLIFLYWAITKTSYYRRFIIENNVNATMLWGIVVVLPAFFLRQMLVQVLLGSGRIVQYNLAILVETIIQLILILLFLIALKEALRGAVIAYVLATISTVVLVSLLVNKKDKIHLSFHWRLFRDSIAYGSRAYFGNIAQFLNYRLDMFIVSAIMGTAAVGYYAVAVGIAEKLWMIPSALGTVLFPKVAYMDKKDATIVTIRSMRHTFYLVLAISVLMAGTAKLLISFLFGEGYSNSVNPLILLLPGVLLLSISKVLTSDLAGRGRPQYGAISSLVSLMANVVLNLMLIPRWGINGAAVATSVSYSLATAIVITSFARLTGTSVLQLFAIQKQDVTIYRVLFRDIFFRKHHPV
jgi:O-antigen/teichoic acid export membrane protein